METDSFFCQLLKQLPQTLFELLGLPAERALAYRFDSVEVKKSLRIDGVFLPATTNLPVMLVEVQFQHSTKFYANLFGKVFWYLEENDPAQEWIAVAIFSSRGVEPKELGPYEDLLRSPRVKRIYLDEYPMPADPPLGLSILQLVSAPEAQAKPLVARLIQKAEAELADSELGQKVVELVEELLIRRYPKFNRDEVRAMFPLTDLRKTRVWQEIHEEGVEEGKRLAQAELVRKCLAKGMTAKEIANFLDISVPEARKLIKSGGD